jgi:spore germination cell wall hydrolase CwlJ-like protein
MRFSKCRRVLPAAILAGLLASVGGASADTVGARVAGNEVARLMSQEHEMLRSASGARIAELTDVIRPKARDEETTVTASSRSADPETELPAATMKALKMVRLDLATLDAMPQASGGGSDLQCLAQAIYFESRGEPLDGQVAVAEVVLNRVDDRAFPGTVCGVTNQGCQFSYTCDGHSDQMRSSLARERSEKLASLMLAGRERTMSDGALYFHTRAVKPSWSRRFTRTTTIGHHLFYRPGTQVAGG